MEFCLKWDKWYKRGSTCTPISILKPRIWVESQPLSWNCRLCTTLFDQILPPKNSIIRTEKGISFYNPFLKKFPVAFVFDATKLCLWCYYICPWCYCMSVMLPLYYVMFFLNYSQSTSFKDKSICFRPGYNTDTILFIFKPDSVLFYSIFINQQGFAATKPFLSHAESAKCIKYILSIDIIVKDVCYKRGLPNVL